MPGSLKTDSLKITLHRMDPMVQISGKILGLFLDDSEKIDMDKPTKPNCCEKTKAVFSCPCAFFSYACKNNIEPCLEMTESLMSKDPSIIPGAEIQRFSKEMNTYAMIILKQNQRPGLKLDEIKEFREDGVPVKSIGSSIKDVSELILFKRSSFIEHLLLLSLFICFFIKSSKRKNFFK